MDILGVDIGGTGIKAAIVDVEKGELRSERLRRPTPRPARPDPVVAEVAALVGALGWDGPIGCGFPGVVVGGKIRTAANLSRRFVGMDLAACLGAACGRPVTLCNDADAAGLAEMRFGAGAGCAGVVLIVTLGTGIGSALFVRGALVPNTELGHLEVDGVKAERRASARVREARGWSWSRFAKELDRVLAVYEDLLHPDLLVLGGGVSKSHDKFLDRLERRAPVVPAHMRNRAGIVGAALAAAPSAD